MKAYVLISLFATVHTLSFGQLIDSSQITAEQQIFVNEQVKTGRGQALHSDIKL